MRSQGQPEEGFNKCVLVTGGAGFIGSHTTLQLLEDGYEDIIIDNLDNFVEEAVNRVRVLVDQRFRQNIRFFLGDLCNKEDVEKVFSLAKGQPNNCSILPAHTSGVRGLLLPIKLLLAVIPLPSLQTVVTHYKDD